MKQNEVNDLTATLILRASQLEATHRRCQDEIKRADKAETELNELKHVYILKKLVDVFKNKFYADYKAAARERDLALLYIQFLSEPHKLKEKQNGKY